jgi:hypothetical protein
MLCSFSQLSGISLPATFLGQTEADANAFLALMAGKFNKSPN